MLLGMLLILDWVLAGDLRGFLQRELVHLVGRERLRVRVDDVPDNTQSLSRRAVAPYVPMEVHIPAWTASACEKAGGVEDVECEQLRRRVHVPSRSLDVDGGRLRGLTRFSSLRLGFRARLALCVSIMAPRRPRSTSNVSASNNIARAPTASPQLKKQFVLALDSIYQNNLNVIKRRDPTIVSILDQFSHVCLYNFNGKEKKWVREGYEGSIFIVEQ